MAHKAPCTVYFYVPIGTNEHKKQDANVCHVESPGPNSMLISQYVKNFTQRNVTILYLKISGWQINYLFVQLKFFFLPLFKLSFFLSSFFTSLSFYCSWSRSRIRVDHNAPLFNSLQPIRWEATERKGSWEQEDNSPLNNSCHNWISDYLSCCSVAEMLLLLLFSPLLASDSLLACFTWITHVCLKLGPY